MPQYSNASTNTQSMPGGFSILLVYDQDEPVYGVERIFMLHGIRVQRSRNCFEARSVLREPAAPTVVVTGLTLPDGDWTDVLRAANVAPARTPVIVVSRLLDIRLYLDVLDSGAHDFVVPPFSSSDLAYIIRTAIRTDRLFTPYNLHRNGPGERPHKFSPMERSSFRPGP